MKVKEESEKVGLKLNIQKMKIMASGPITSWQIDGETVETMADFILGGSKITADGDCSHEIKRRFLFGRKVMNNLDCILKSRDITLTTKDRLVKAMVFPVVTYTYESWTIKKAECWRIDAFELWYWRRLLRVPWTARRSNQSILKEINPNIHWMNWCWSWSSNTLATWCEELTPWKRPWCWERLKMRGEGDDRGWDGWMASPTQWTWIWTNCRRWWRTRKPGMLQSKELQRAGHDWITELNWTEGNLLNLTLNLLISKTGITTITNIWKVVTNLESILNSRDITLLTKLRLVKAMVFPVVMYGYESWIIKKAERWRIDAFELWYSWEDSWEDSWEFVGLQGDPTN